ncbi:Uncharacterised protein [Slackia heliotrinireducens]|uniref:Uncharacterized protein n=1 Tax=Slackia heliotrinireducens (strain ATCC 29202 / DSM 20476 / NCTC 11029 / RHS 1) TaxID=471855 RepID=C7N8D8_SLAHD|nr:PGPGW domain-containing protein [Slackia heliotrinireducens]ACV23173.1 hypothetical protein Shel_21630 [Slackia heliotrinireducens DSM 20476]VEH02242.1 Uncharacterised protein [Slackia heliotrinireducens]
MKTSNENFYEAYVINNDGTKTSAPMTFVERPNNPFGNGASAQAVAYTPGLHLGRRILGLGLVAIGIPMLILPGPGLLAVTLGLSMALLP